MSKNDNDSNSSSDESLDFTSKNFDPLKALYAPKVKLPVPDAVKLDNLQQYDIIAKQMKQTYDEGEVETFKPPVDPTKNTERSSESKNNPIIKKELEDIRSSKMNVAGPSSYRSSLSKPKEPYRRFLPHQEMIPAAPRAPKRNVVTRMEDAPAPFQRLWEAVNAEPRVRVRVVTRNQYGIHGRLEGYLELFDKHWNLAMRDVTEVFYRRSPRRANECVLGDSAAELGDRLAALAVCERLPAGKGRGRARASNPARHPGGPATTSLPDPLDLVSLQELTAGKGKGRGKRTREELADWQPLPKVFWRAHGKRQECLRHVDQLLVRGEHVVFIQFLAL